MLRLFRRLAARLGDVAARAEIEALRRDARVREVEVEALKLERDSLAAVVARDRQRVAAETQEAAARIVRAGG